MPQSAIALALACFNIGVELGQLAFVGFVLAILYLLARRPEWPLSLRKLAPYTIGSVSMFWVIERLSRFA